MSENEDSNGRPFSGRAPLTLKPRPTGGGGGVSTGTVKQSFSHGRTKTVVVETKRRRPDAPPVEHRPAAPLPPRAPRPEAAKPALSTPTLGDAHGLSQTEVERRQRVIEAARAEQDRQDAARRAVEDAQRAEEVATRREAEAVEVQRHAAEEVRPAAEPTPVAAQTEAPVAAEPAAPVRPTVMARASEAAPPAEPAVYGDRPAAPAASRPPPASAGLGERPRPVAPSTTSGFGERSRADRAGATALGSRPGTDRAPRSDAPPARYGDRPATGAGAFGARPRPEGPVAPRYGDRPAGAAPFGARPRPEGGGFGERPRPEGRAFGERPPPREGGPGFGERGPRAPREAGAGDGTVRYSAATARPAGPRTGPGARGPGGPRGPAAASSAPEFTKTSRTGPRTGEGPRRSFDDDGPRKAGALRPGRGENTRRQGRLTIQAVAGDEDSAERMRSLASVRRAREREKERRRGGVAEPSRTAREVVIPDTITVGELAQRMAIRAIDVIKFMMRQSIMLKINDVIDTDTAELVATEYGMTVKRVSESDVETGFILGDEEDEDTQPRPPVVAVMGHVDHGKTSLLDALRQTNVTQGEAGGITQHIGAYQVQVASGERVTFLDTPGHAAFSAMRARGANVTDVVILVVAADDGVMPQTIEAINHAKAAGAPIIVAVNKIDKPDADPTRVVNELLQHEIVAESLGGDTQIVEVSATQKLGLDDLINGVLLQAEVMDLRANPDRTGEGVVIESKLDKGRGPVATVLVKRGTLKRGDIVVAGSQWGRVRALIDEKGAQKLTAGPSEPVEVLGLDGAPEPGEPMAVVENEARAREIVGYRLRVKREKQVGLTGGVSMADMMARLQNKKISELPLVIKADVGGSAEAIAQSLKAIGNEEVSARLILSGVGGITESDIMLAKGAGAPVIGFNVRASAQARALATREGVEIRYYAIIYDLLDDIKGVLSGMLAPIQRETFLGNAEILQVFDISKVGKIGGCKVTEGVVRKGAKVRILRNDVVIHDLGTLVTLKRFKDEVNEVVSGQECGMNFGNFQDVKEGDFIECFSVEEIRRTL